MQGRSWSRLRTIAIVLASSSVPALAAQEAFTFDRNHTLIGFRIRHILTRVEGRFRDFDGTIWIDRQDPGASRVELAIQAASIDTGVPDRDNDLRSPNFFDVVKYPAITFKSTKIEPKGNDAYLVTGDLAMHGVTKSIQIPVKHGGFAKMGKGEKAGFEAALTLDRKDYGITWNRPLDQGGTLLGDEVEITLQVEANKKQREAAPSGGRQGAPGRP